jgi:HlyD family secretion protein
MSNFIEEYLCCAVFCVLALFGCNSSENTVWSGNFEAEDYIVASGSEGKIVEMYVKEGDLCSAGDILAVTDTVMLVFERERIERAMESLRASLPDKASKLAVLSQKIAAIEREMERVVKLVEAGSAGEKMADEVQDRLDVARREYYAAERELDSGTESLLSQIEARRVELEMTEERIDRSVMYAPFDSRVLQVNFREGEYLSTGMPVMKLSKSTEILFVAWVPGPDLYSVSAGDSVKILYDRGETLASVGGMISRISEVPMFLPSMVQTRGSRAEQHYKVEAVVINEGDLKPGMPGEMILE